MPFLRQARDGFQPGQTHQDGPCRTVRGVEEVEVMALRTKRMPKNEFDKIADRQWVPVMLAGDGSPYWIKGIPEDKVEYILASGTYIDPRVVELNGVTYGDAVGGIDVYRYDEKDVDKGSPINKDHYILVRDPHEDNLLLIYGPLKDNEHWLEQLPDLPNDIEVIESTED